MKLYLAGGMSYRELLFGGAIMNLYLVAGGGQWAKHIAPTVFKEKTDADIPSKRRGGLELVSKPLLEQREHKDKGEYP